MIESFDNRDDKAMNGEKLHYITDATTENFNKIFLNLSKWIGTISD